MSLVFQLGRKGLAEGRLERHAWEKRASREGGGDGRRPSKLWPIVGWMGREGKRACAGEATGEKHAWTTHRGELNPLSTVKKDEIWYHSTISKKSLGGRGKLPFSWIINGEIEKLNHRGEPYYKLEVK